jgi:signal transduction histidine kinase
MRIAPNYPEINIEFKEEIIVDKELSPSQGIQLMRIMQEALTNALKHAQASEITISIQSAAGIVVSIVDNGKGFDAETVTRGQGLQNMEQRANEAGFGLVFIHEGPGVAVVISVP